MIVDLKAEHPALNNNEITNIVYVRTGRRLGDHAAERVFSEEVVPLKLSRLFEPYHEIEDSRERRSAVVMLHLDGWSVKRVASYMILGLEALRRGKSGAEGDGALAAAGKPHPRVRRRDSFRV